MWYRIRARTAELLDVPQPGDHASRIGQRDIDADLEAVGIVE